jgi:hypothetical protein
MLIAKKVLFSLAGQLNTKFTSETGRVNEPLKCTIQGSCTLAKFTGENVGDSNRICPYISHLGDCDKYRIIWPR